jgi:hypothetical protein
MSNDLKWMIGSDFHIPYEHPRYIDLWWQVMKWFEPDVVDILGDLDDNSACSRFSDGTPDETMNAAAKYAPLVKGFFATGREITPGAQWHFATGNHEIRYDNYIAKKAPALEGLITPELLWGTDTHGIELSYYNNPPVHRFGKYFVHHGPYAVGKGGDSVRKVMDDFGVSCIVGHSHRQALVQKSWPLRGEILTGIELGHMTDIESSGMGYDLKHDWQPGFAIAHIENGNTPHVQLIQISDDFSAYVDGKRFQS